MSQSPFGPPSDKDVVGIPEWARVTADFTGVEDVNEPTNTPGKPPKPRRSLRSKKTKEHSKKESQPRTKASTGSLHLALRKWRGGRWMVLAVRVGIAFVVIILSLLGIMRIANPVPIDEADIVAEIENRLEIVDFPSQSGERLAGEYVREYFTWVAGDTNDNLLALLPPNAEFDFRPNVGADVVSMTVLQGPYLQDRPEYLSATSAVFTFRVEVETVMSTKDAESPTGTVETTTRQWWTVSVPVLVQDEMTVIAAPPSLIPAVGSGSKPELVSIDIDEETSKAAEEYLRIYFEQWAQASEAEPVASAYLLSDRSTDNARYGLDGLVELARINSVQIPVQELAEGETDTGEKTADVFLVWRDVATGLEVSASYRLDLLLRDNYWYVLDIKGGSFAQPR